MEERAASEDKSTTLLPLPTTGSNCARELSIVSLELRECRSVITRERSPLRESRTVGSVRGAASNRRPYRDSKISSARATASPPNAVQRRGAEEGLAYALSSLRADRISE